jgi:hypothetical protein
LPEGTPFGLVGSSSMLKRESYPNGAVPEGSVTATFVGKDNAWRGLDEFTSHGNGMALNWHNQGADAGLYDNSKVHAVRVLAMEATTDRKGGERSGRQFHSHAKERLRILGEIPVRKFNTPGANASGLAQDQPLDPDGNPDTSFLAKIPADVAFTFQTLDKQGLVLNMAQTWHQLRPGEIRTDCGGCHAHSQKPTNFADTLAARPDYKVFDLTSTTPLITTKDKDESKRQWDADDSSGVRTVKSAVVDVEYHRDIKPILQRSCIACHSGRDGKTPAALLDLDADDEQINSERAHAKLPGTYLRLAEDEAAKFGHKPVAYDSWGAGNASRYVRKLQSRRSLLTWKIFGRRLDGFSNDDHPSESAPGKKEMMKAGQVVPLEKNRSNWDLDYVGSQMPPPEAVTGAYKSDDGKTIKVPPLSDEDRRTIARWIDLGCPIDLDLSPVDPDKPFGWFCDDQRPTLTLNHPATRVEQLDRLQIGMYDYGPGLNAESLSVTADVELDGVAAGSELADKFKSSAEQVWQWKLAKPLTKPGKVTINVSVRDVQGNLTRVSRTVRLGK